MKTIDSRWYLSRRILFQLTTGLRSLRLEEGSRLGVVFPFSQIQRGRTAMVFSAENGS
ncbi:hypothetical protein JW905_17870 [bacterium]|nr:hypothetical protein [candidate division CSSED10-310 bacterium]